MVSWTTRNKLQSNSDKQYFSSHFENVLMLMSPANHLQVAMEIISGVYKGEGPFDVFVNLRSIPLLAMTEVSVRI